MTRRTTGLLAMLLPAALLCNAAAAERKPNFVFMLADDLGWRDTGIYGSTYYRTPNIDGLAKRALRFTDAYSASPLCSPTRASILTGQHPGRLRFTTPAGHLKEEILDPKVPERAGAEAKMICPETRTRLPNDCVTIAEALKEAGYATGFMGKWHLGRAPYIPENQGFDVVVGGREHPGPPPPGHYFAPWNCDTLPKAPPGTHISDVLGQEAVKFIEKNRAQPFLLALWWYDVHAPFLCEEGTKKLYEGRTDPQGLQNCPTMGAMIETLDRNVGRVVDALDRLGLAENTVVFFTSDNGGNMYNTIDGTTPTNNSPLRNGKGSIWEGGHRVPLLVAWPGVTRAGAVSAEIISSVDYYPTILEGAGLRPMAGQILDGISILPALRGGRLEREAVFCHFPHYIPSTGNLPATSARSGNFKLIRYFGEGRHRADKIELFDLAADIGETRDLAAQMPDRAAAMDALITRFLADTRALVPARNPAYLPGAEGWAGTKTTTLTIADGTLRISSAKPDPQITNSKVPAIPGELACEFRMKSRGNGPGTVYWATAKTPKLQRALSKDFPAVHDGQWHGYRVALDADSALKMLRIDPAAGPVEAEVDDIRLLNRKGEVLRIWSFEAPPDRE